ncbi:PHB depolymerase family esterase [Frigoribacterium sp. CG_9.8]|uniref:alpha/beta hydrolase family esterase n=1 Tax=Frigoribacterium sp. CG_9.8 TaxID=2787733 RepID=UPI0018C95C3A|nr:polyhydroxybutyrate depolymerase [Frigoribacterium sp. CG_9.8]
MSSAVKRSVLVAGMRRTYLRVAPAAAATASATGRALVLVLHGSNQSANTIRRYSDRTFDSLAGRGAVVAYLDGFRGDWNDARVSSISAARRNEIDDVAFVTAVIDDLATHDRVDRDRVFIVGFSAGGYMTIRVIHEIPDRIAGAGLISATHADAANFFGSRYESAPISVTMFHGTSDLFVKYGGQSARRWGPFRGGGMLSAPGTAKYFAQRNGILTPGAQRQVSADVVETVYADGVKPQVRLFSITGKGHTIPGARGNLFAGHSTRSIVAAQVLADHWALPSAVERMVVRDRI